MGKGAERIAVALSGIAGPAGGGRTRLPYLSCPRIAPAGKDALCTLT